MTINEHAREQDAARLRTNGLIRQLLGNVYLVDVDSMPLAAGEWAITLTLSVSRGHRTLSLAGTQARQLLDMAIALESTRRAHVLRVYEVLDVDAPWAERQEVR